MSATTILHETLRQIRQFVWSLFLARRTQADPDLCLLSQFTSTFLTTLPTDLITIFHNQRH